LGRASIICIRARIQRAFAGKANIQTSANQVQSFQTKELKFGALKIVM
jgi:hypothetical protein